jgi:hypothetical protein
LCPPQIRGPEVKTRVDTIWFEEQLGTLDQQVSEKWDPKGPEKTLVETASAF